MKKIAGIAVVVAAGLVALITVMAAGCTGSNSTPGRPAGTSYTVHGIDPASGAAYSYTVVLNTVNENAHPAGKAEVTPAGQHLIAAQFTITGLTSTSSLGNANDNATVIGTDTRKYTASPGDVTGGTNFSDGYFNVASGPAMTGWVSFQVPDGVNAAAVRWTDEPGGSTVTWDLSR